MTKTVSKPVKSKSLKSSPPKSHKSRNRKAQDATLINLDALKRRVRKLQVQVDGAHHTVYALSARVEELEAAMAVVTASKIDRDALIQTIRDIVEEAKNPPPTVE